MELRHLRYFVAVAEHLHFGRAAEELVTAQPSLSRQIAQLEDELGIELFERNNRRVALTEAGRSFLTGARRTLATADASVRHAHENAAGTRGELRVGYLAGAMLGNMPKLLRRYRENFPDVEVAPFAYPFPQLVPALRAGSIDVAWSLPSAEPDVAMRTVETISLMAALPQGHPLAGRKRISIAQFSEEHLVVLAPDRGPLHEITFEVCASAGYRPQHVHEAHEDMGVLGLVAAGFGIALVPRVWSAIHMPGVSYVDTDRDYSAEQVLMWLRDRDRPLVRNFVATACTQGDC